MNRALLAVAFAALAWTGSIPQAAAQTLTMGPAHDPVVLDREGLAAHAAEVVAEPDGSTSYRDVTVEGDGWRVSVAALTVSGVQNTRGPTPPARLKAAISVFNFGAMPLTFVIDNNTPATLSGDVTAGGSAALIYTDANLDGAGGATQSGSVIPVEISVDGVRTGVAILDELGVVPGHGGQTLGKTGSVGLPDSDESIPTPSTSIGAATTFVLSPGDMMGMAITLQAVEAGAGAVGAPDDASMAAGEEREVQVELVPMPSKRGVDADPVRIITLGLGATNNTMVNQTYTFTSTAPVGALIGGTVMGGTLGLGIVDANFNAGGGVASSGAEPIFEGSADGNPASMSFLDSVGFTPTTIGEAFTVIRTEGLPGPSLAPGPAVSSNISLQLKFVLAPGEAVAATALFAVGTPQCPSSPAACSAVFDKASLTADSSKTGKEKLVVSLSKGPEASQTELGNPLIGAGTAYDVCIYNDGGVLAGGVHVDRAGEDCSGKPCWKPAGAAPPDGKGYIYSDKTGSAGGAKSLKVLGGKKTKVKLVGKNKKNQLSLPAGIPSALQGSASATIQFHGSDVASCYGATLGEVITDNGEQFKAKK